jgi:YlmC/YmxH family sporulation protein
MRVCELKQKEIINASTCRSLGCPVDVEFDCKTSKLTALVVPGPGKFCFFWGKASEYIIPWECICQIGDDIILVEIDEEKCFHRE